MSRRCALWALSAMLLASAARAQGLDLAWPDALAPWHVSGDLSARYEHLGDAGDIASSPYAFVGPQIFGEAALTFDRRFSPFETMRGDVLGLANGSEYRSPEDGFTAERLRFEWEKGDGAVPFRAIAGDYFGYLSLRTLQQPLKGLELELQPNLGDAEQRQSLLFFTGIDQAVYRDIDLGANVFSGASWLVEDARLGSLAVNLVHNLREADRAAGLPRRDQVVTSLAAERSFETASQRITLEGEVGLFYGDHDVGGAVVEDEGDIGLFAELRGRGLEAPYSYRVLLERYGEDYAPVGAAVPADRSSVELHGGWRFSGGLAVDGRLQRFETAMQSPDPTETETAGITFSGPFDLGLLPGLSGRLDVFAQRAENRSHSLRTRTYNARLDLAFPIAAALSGRADLLLRRTHDRNTAADGITREAAFGVDYAFALGGLDGTLSPELRARTISGGASTAVELQPSLALALAGDGHEVRLDYRLLDRDRRAAGTADLTTHDASLAYVFTAGPHRLRFAADFDDREPEGARFTRAYRVGLTYTFSFDKPAEAALRPVTPPGQPPAPPETLDLRMFAPGTLLTDAEAELARRGIAGALELAGVSVYELALLPEVRRRQRLALVHVGPRLAKAALIVEFDDVGDIDDQRLTFERVREALVRRYGPPARTFALGDFGPDFVADVNTERFIRTAEWDLPEGTLRLGIPRRLDGRVRIEVQLAPRFESPRQTLWSVEPVR